MVDTVLRSTPDRARLKFHNCRPLTFPGGGLKNVQSALYAVGRTHKRRFQNDLLPVHVNSMQFLTHEALNGQVVVLEVGYQFTYVIVFVGGQRQRLHLEDGPQ